MNVVMKKITALSLSAIPFLTLVPQAHAQTQKPVKLCPGGEFSGLCKLDLNDFSGIIATLIQIAFVIGVIIALAFLIFGGIKWITSGGDSKQIDGARNMIVAALIGLAIMFLSFFILNILLGFFGINLLDLTVPTLQGFLAS